METGNITHEQIEIEDAKEACVKKGKVVSSNPCKYTLDVEIDGVLYEDLEICYHCQNEKKFTPEKAFDLFDPGVEVFVLCNTEEGGSIERKVIGLAPTEDDPYPRLCGLKRFFAKVQEIGSDGYPMWDSLDSLYPVPVCSYYWIFFEKDGSVRVDKVRKEDIPLLDKVTDIPEGSDSVFAKAFMLNIGECDQRYVAEQHLLIKDRQIKFDQGAGFPVTNCTYVQYSPPNRFYCNVGTGDMVWSHIIEEDCPIFLGMILHVNLEDGSIGESHAFDCNGYENYFCPPSSETDGIDGWAQVQIGNANINDGPLDLIPEITGIKGTVISGYMNYLGRPMAFTFDVVTAESHWSGGKDSQDADHLLWTEKGFETVSSWHFEQEINPIETGDHRYDYHDDGDYGPIENFYTDPICVYMYEYCQDQSAHGSCDKCTAKCHHCHNIAHDYTKEWSQGDNGHSYVSFSALSTSGDIDNKWHEASDSVSHSATFLACYDIWHADENACECMYAGQGSYTNSFGGGRNGSRSFHYRKSNSYKIAWVSPNCTYIEKQITRNYDLRSLSYVATQQYPGQMDRYGSDHCGGPEVDDFNRWTLLSSECLACVAGTPDFDVPFLDLDGWPPWPEGYTQEIWYQGEPYYEWHLDRSINLNDIQEPYIREFDMGNGITFSADIYEIPYYLDDRTANPSIGLVVAAKGYQDYSNAAGSSHWKIYHDGIDVTDKILNALKCDPAVLVTIGMV